MNLHDLLEQLKRYPVFDLATFENITQLGPKAASVRLFRMKASGYIHGLSRDRYTVHNDPIIIASRVVWPSYISLSYAMNRHGLTTQSPHVIEVLTTRKVFRSRYEIGNMGIELIKVNPRFLFGYDRVRYGEHEIFLATPEKAVIDGLLLRRISASETTDILSENIGRLDVDRMVEFTVRCRNSALAKRVGYLLDRLGHDRHKRLRKLTVPTVLPLDWTLPKKGTLDRKWMVLDNVKRPVEVV